MNRRTGVLLALAALAFPAGVQAQTIPPPPPGGALVPERIEPGPPAEPRPSEGNRGPVPRSLPPPVADPGIVAPTPMPEPSPMPLVPPPPPGQPRPGAPR